MREYFTANWLIQAFGDRAYQRGLDMTVAATQSGDVESSRQLADACIELMQRGYHQKPLTPPAPKEKASP